MFIPLTVLHRLSRTKDANKDYKLVHTSSRKFSCIPEWELGLSPRCLELRYFLLNYGYHCTHNSLSPGTHHMVLQLALYWVLSSLGGRSMCPQLTWLGACCMVLAQYRPSNDCRIFQMHRIFLKLPDIYLYVSCLSTSYTPSAVKILVFWEHFTLLLSNQLHQNNRSSLSQQNTKDSYFEWKLLVPLW